MDILTEQLAEKLKDERSKKVIFVSHCILNINVRYLGGAFRKSGINEIIDEIQKNNIGIIQMRCPEKEAWGGVTKPYSWLSLKIKSSFIVKTFYPVFMWRTKLIYRKIAKKVVKDMQNYQNSGFEIIGIVGISASPTCSISKTIDGRKFLDYLSNKKVDDIKRENLNDFCIKGALVDGNGLYILELKRILKKKKMDIRFYEHDLIREMNNEIINFEI